MSWPHSSSAYRQEGKPLLAHEMPMKILGESPGLADEKVGRREAGKGLTNHMGGEEGGGKKSDG